MELEDVFEDATEIGGLSEICEVANVVEVRGRPEVVADTGQDGNAAEISSPTLTESQSEVAGGETGASDDIAEPQIRSSNPEAQVNVSTYHTMLYFGRYSLRSRLRSFNLIN